jgi:hypothetical protein
METFVHEPLQFFVPAGMQRPPQTTPALLTAGQHTVLQAGSDPQLAWQSGSHLLL